MIDVFALAVSVDGFKFLLREAVRTKPSRPMLNVSLRDTMALDLLC